MLKERQNGGALKIWCTQNGRVSAFSPGDDGAVQAGDGGDQQVVILPELLREEEEEESQQRCRMTGLYKICFFRRKRMLPGICMIKYQIP